MATFDFFYEVSMAERGGFGIWYEYLAKFRIFKRFKKSKKVLIFGLPRKYSLGLDTLYFSDYSEVHIVDDQIENLKEYKKYADQFKKKVKIISVESLKKAAILKKEKYDLLISTEVLQEDISLFNIMKELSETIIVFVPNKNCYAHPLISKLKSLSLKKLKELGKENNLKIIDSGYIDCPLWPAGACLPKSEEGKINKKEAFYISMIKKALTKIIPKLVKIDNHYPWFWRKLNSHMAFCIYKK
jgi:hypothetical protein